MEEISNIFLNFIDSWGYLAIAVLMALENACVPIPSELILGFSGYLVSIGRMSFIDATLSGMIGGIIGSIFAYVIGVSGGRKFVDRYGRYILLKKSHVDLAQKWFDKYGVHAVFFSRMLPVIRTFISLPAGFAKVRFRQFLFFTILGSLPWTVLILYAGVFLGRNWRYLLDLGHQFSVVVILLIIIAFIWIYRKKSTHN